jgi:hypothetical protein
VAGGELHRGHEPLTHEVLQVHLCKLGRGTVFFHHGSWGTEKQHSLRPKNLPSLSLSSGVGKEAGRQWLVVREDVGVGEGDCSLL